MPTDAVRHDASNKNGEGPKKSVDELKAATAVKAEGAGLQATAGDNIPEQGPILENLLQS